jgi:DNA-directed RNA polymerase specialized sigma subunit
MARKAKSFKLSEVQQRLASDNINLARREAWRLQRTTEIDYDTLEGAALEGLCKAAYRYDSSSGFKFSSLAVPTIRGELLHYIRDRTYSMKLTHRMRETWIKGRRLIYKGFTDTEIAASLEIDQQDWQEIKSVCSGPPLELTDQAKSGEELQPDEIDFYSILKERTERAWDLLPEEAQNSILRYYEGNTSKVPHSCLQRLVELAYDSDLF